MTSSRSTATPLALIDEVRFPLLLHPIRDGESGQPLFNLHLGDHILLAIGLEKLPFGGVMLGQVAAPLAIGLGGLAGDAEITDEGLAGIELLLVLGEPQGLAGGVQTCRVAAVEAMKHGAAPLVWRQGAHVLGQTAPFKGGVVGVLDVLRAGDGLDQPRGEPLPRARSMI